MSAFADPRQLPPNPSIKLRANQPASQPASQLNEEIVTLLFTRNSSYTPDSCAGDSTQHNQHILPFITPSIFRSTSHSNQAKDPI